MVAETATKTTRLLNQLYHANRDSGTSKFKFAGSMERVNCVRDSHRILSVFLRYVTSFYGIKEFEECMKRGLSESLDA